MVGMQAKGRMNCRRRTRKVEHSQQGKKGRKKEENMKDPASKVASKGEACPYW